jgi:hypothetical protein
VGAHSAHGPRPNAGSSTLRGAAELPSARGEDSGAIARAPAAQTHGSGRSGGEPPLLHGPVPGRRCGSDIRERRHRARAGGRGSRSAPAARLDLMGRGGFGRRDAAPLQWKSRGDPGPRAHVDAAVRWLHRLPPESPPTARATARTKRPGSRAHEQIERRRSATNLSVRAITGLSGSPHEAGTIARRMIGRRHHRGTPRLGRLARVHLELGGSTRRSGSSGASARKRPSHRTTASRTSSGAWLSGSPESIRRSMAMRRSTDPRGDRRAAGGEVDRTPVAGSIFIAEAYHFARYGRTHQVVRRTAHRIDPRGARRPRRRSHGRTPDPKIRAAIL